MQGWRRCPRSIRTPITRRCLPRSKPCAVRSRRPTCVVFCTPEYAGTLPGSFKNLLDWTVGGAEMSDKPTTWINVAAPGRGTGADAALALVLGYVGAAVMDASGVRVPVPHQAIDPSGRISDPDTRDRLRDTFETIIAEVRQGRTTETRTR